jgi:hypothetical protein
MVPHIFAVTPFRQPHDDLYDLAIREPALEMGFTCDRADRVLHSGFIDD